MKKFFIVLIFPAFLGGILAAFPFSCFSGRDGGIQKSIDRGENWLSKNFISKSQSLATYDILSLRIDPQNQQVLYLGTRGQGLYKSIDGGEIWYAIKDINNLLTNRANVYDTAIDPRNPNNIYLGTYQDRYGRLFRSGDAGKSWEEVYRVSREKYAIFAVEIDTYEPAVVYMGTAEGGLLKSVDFGKNWKVIKWFDDVITDIKVNPHDTRTVFVSTSDKGIFKTTDKGQTWQKLEGLKNFREAEKVETLVMDNKNPNVLYTGSQNGLLKSADGGQSWRRVDIVVPPESVVIQAVALDPVFSSSFYYTAGNVIYRSDDNGQTWSSHPLGTKRNVQVITIDPLNPNILYAGLHD